MRKLLISAKHNLSIRQQCNLLSISRASFYYVAKQEHADNLKMKPLMDASTLEEPIVGVLTNQPMLEEQVMKGKEDSCALPISGPSTPESI